MTSPALRSATHESGHAIAAMHYGLPVVDLQLHECTHHAAKDPYIAAVICFAGPMAECRFLGLPPPQYSYAENSVRYILPRGMKESFVALLGVAEDDLEPAEDEYAEMPHDSDDLTMAMHHLGGIGGDEVGRMHKWYCAQAEAARLVGEHWEAITRLAERLAEVGTMDGEQVRELLGSYAPPLSIAGECAS